MVAKCLESFTDDLKNSDGLAFDGEPMSGKKALKESIWHWKDLSQGVNFKVIQEQLGHANIQETMNTYSHLTEKDKKSASELCNHFL